MMKNGFISFDEGSYARCDNTTMNRTDQDTIIDLLRQADWKMYEHKAAYYHGREILNARHKCQFPAKWSG